MRGRRRLHPGMPPRRYGTRRPQGSHRGPQPLYGVEGPRHQLPERCPRRHARCGLRRLYHQDLDQGQGQGGLWRSRLLLGDSTASRFPVADPANAVRPP